ncbi:MAG: hypothetical protein WC451_02940 [Patescibacteria group bacterium]|jgi:hypothetical protein
MTDQKFIDKIKSRGYWRVNIRPVIIPAQDLTLPECKEYIEKSSLELRGWDYPHIPRRSGDDTGILRHSNFVEAWVDWSYFKEFWRMYKTSQFLHYFGFRIDWMSEEEPIFGNQERVPEPKTELGVLDTTWQVTEIFEFASRLVQTGLYDKGVVIDIALYNLDGRKLTIDNPGRMRFMFDRKTGANDYYYSKILTKEEIISNSKSLAYDVIKGIFELFGWDDLPIETIKKDQEDLLSRRF